jgi:hypothetical protein
MKGRKWNGREGRSEGRDIREEKGEEIGGKWLEGGWGEGCAHRCRGIDPLFVLVRNTYNSFLRQN